MTEARADAFDPASFRDPAGRVFYRGDVVYRTLAAEGLRDFQAAVSAGLIHDLARGGSIPHTELTSGGGFTSVGTSAEPFLIRQPRLQPLTYSYEWPFGMLQAAALLTLRVLRQCLERGFILKDGSAFNVVFDGTAPRFVDVVSIEPYREGQIWFGYAQFCRSFLAPLLLASRRRIPFQPLLRAYMGELPLDVASALLGPRTWLSPAVLFHMHLQARFNRSFGAGSVDATRLSLPLPALLRQVTQLERLIAGLTPASTQTIWTTYGSTCSYSAAAQDHKRELVRARLGTSRPGIVIDLGCNTGDYSALALDSGSAVVSVDADPAASDVLYRRFRGSTRVAPVVADLANPTPDMGWAQTERRGLLQRLRGDFLLALAILHHLRIAAGIPLISILDVLAGVAPEGLIEWVDRSDPMVKTMLQGRADVFHDYHWDTFSRLLSERAWLVSVEDVSETRKLCHYRTRGQISTRAARNDFGGGQALPGPCNRTFNDCVSSIRVTKTQ